MNQYMLPHDDGKDFQLVKYGNIAIEQLITKMKMIGADMENLIVKIFGGSHIFDYESGIGAKNIEIAYKLLKKLKIPVISSSTEGRKGRKFSFNTFTGEVLLKYI